MLTTETARCRLLSSSLCRLIPLVCLTLACDDDGTDPITIPELPPRVGIVDEFPAWSPDGSSVAYHRTILSSEGPPGIYLINRDGTDNSLLLDETALNEEGAYPFIEDLCFSPDASQLALALNLEIFLLSVDSGTLSQLTFTGHNARSPDWSPDGKHIVYERPFLRSPILDSAGTYIVAVASGKERALFSGGIPIYGGSPKWSPGGEPIAFWSGEGSETLDIFSVRSDGTDFRRLTDSGSTAFAQYPRWLHSGMDILYTWRLTRDALSVETRVMHADGAAQQTWPLHLYDSDAISPDSEEVVLPGLQPESGDSLVVLFLRGITDVAGTSLRQLTTYRPPSPHSQSSTRPYNPQDKEVLPWLAPSPQLLRPFSSASPFQRPSSHKHH